MAVEGLTFHSDKTVDHSSICIVVSLFVTLLICYIYRASKVCSQSGLSCLVSQLHHWNYCTRGSAKKVYESAFPFCVRTLTYGKRLEENRFAYTRVWTPYFWSCYLLYDCFGLTYFKGEEFFAFSPVSYAPVATSTK